MNSSKRNQRRYINSGAMKSRHHEIRKENIRRFMRDRGLRYKTLKAETGIDGNYLNRIVNQESAGVGDRIVNQLVTFFNLPSDFFDREYNPNSNNGELRSIPLILQGDYNNYMDGIIETERLISISSDLWTPVAFAVIYEGDAMSPELITGDQVIVDPDINPSSGDIVYCYIDKLDAHVFRFFVIEAGKPVFKPSNTIYDIATAGKVVAVAQGFTRRL